MLLWILNIIFQCIFQQLDKCFVLGMLNDLYPHCKINKKIYSLRKQKGGAPFQKEEQFFDKGGLYTYVIYVNDQTDNPQERHIAILTQDNKECVTILTNKITKEAILHNMSYYQDCAMEGLRKFGDGSKLLRLLLI